MIPERLKIVEEELEFEIMDCIFDIISINRAYSDLFIPVRKKNSRYVIAFADPMNSETREYLSIALNADIEIAEAEKSSIINGLNYYKKNTKKSGVSSVISFIRASDKEKIIERETQELPSISDMLKKPTAIDATTNPTPIINITNAIIREGIKKGASDIHLEPFEDKMIIRFRIDGILYEEYSPPAHLYNMILSRIKIMANLDISEKRKPQDGRMRVNFGKNEIDVRVSILPSYYGESIVLRILNKSTLSLRLDDLGIEPNMLKEIKNIIRCPNGITLVTGPTGSGKSTTLYSSLREINSTDKKVVTLEDPIEYQLSNVIQMQVNNKTGFDFTVGFRSILRHDPDIIMVGEIRDVETARIAVQASLTGHLVFSTLHTNDAPGALMRLVNMGVEPFLVAAGIRGILAQRLVRKLCNYCKYEQKTEIKELKFYGINSDGNTTTYKNNVHGCKECNYTGYKGRIGIFELLIVNDIIRELLINKADITEIRKHAIGQGMVTLQANGWENVKKGLTTLEEVFRVTWGEIEEY